MPTWITDRFEVLREALTLRRVLAISLLFAAFTIAATFAERIGEVLSRGGGRTLFGAAPWAWGAIASLALFGWFMLEYGLALKREVTPRVRLSFDARKSGMTFAIERTADVGPLKRESRAAYLRFRVETLAKKAVRDCTAHLIGIWKLQATEFREVDLPHVIALGPPQFDVLPYAPRMIDFLRCNAGDNQLIPTGPWPFHLEDTFANPGTYRFKFAVEAEGVSETLTVDVHWNCAWNTVKAEQVADVT